MTYNISDSAAYSVKDKAQGNGTLTVAGLNKDAVINDNINIKCTGVSSPEANFSVKWDMGMESTSFVIGTAAGSQFSEDLTRGINTKILNITLIQGTTGFSVGDEFVITTSYNYNSYRRRLVAPDGWKKNADGRSAMNQANTLAMRGIE